MGNNIAVLSRKKVWSNVYVFWLEAPCSVFVGLEFEERASKEAYLR